MIEFITKSEYWKLLDEDIEKDLRKNVFPWHLKSIQDAVVYSHIKGSEGKRIAEIGGGDSRMLEVLAKHNQCTNIEKFEGRDGGPGEEIEFSKVTNVHAFVGEFSKDLQESSFDTLFSVSVIEHVPNPQLPDFIADCRRILKPGGRMIHLVDMYLNEDRRGYNQSRVELYNSAFDRDLFAPLEAPKMSATDDLAFKEAYCTNPDNMMYMWNSVAPDLRELRENSQSVTLIWAGVAM